MGCGLGSMGPPACYRLHCWPWPPQAAGCCCPATCTAPCFMPACWVSCGPCYSTCPSIRQPATGCPPARPTWPRCWTPPQSLARWLPWCWFRPAIRASGPICPPWWPWPSSAAYRCWLTRPMAALRPSLPGPIWWCSPARRPRAVWPRVRPCCCRGSGWTARPCQGPCYGCRPPAPAPYCWPPPRRPSPSSPVGRGLAAGGGPAGWGSGCSATAGRSG